MEGYYRKEGGARELLTRKIKGLIQSRLSSFGEKKKKNSRVLCHADYFTGIEVC